MSVKLYLGYWVSSDGKRLLAASKKKTDVAEYLFNIRGIHPDNYTIKEVKISESVAESMYSDYMLETWNEVDRTKITALDKHELKKEMFLTSLHISNMTNDLDKFIEEVSIGNRYYNDVYDKELKILKKASKALGKLNKKKMRPYLKTIVLRSSRIFTSNINEYVGFMNANNECKKLDNEFKSKIHDEDKPKIIYDGLDSLRDAQIAEHKKKKKNE